MSLYSAISANTTNATVVKATSGRLFRVQVSNANAAVRYLKFYAQATAPNPATDSPTLRYMIPAGDSIQINVDEVFATGIAFVLVTGAADNSTDAVSASEHFVNIQYD